VEVRLRLTLSSKMPTNKVSYIRLDVDASEIIYERMRKAIHFFNNDPAVQELKDTPDSQYILQGTYLRDILLRSFSPATPSAHSSLQEPDEKCYPSRQTLEHPSRVGDHEGIFKEDARIMSWARRYREMDPIRIDGDPVLSGLNATQTRAIAMMIGERISLLQGVRI